MSLADYSPWAPKESDATEVNEHVHMQKIQNFIDVTLENFINMTLESSYVR